MENINLLDVAWLEKTASNIRDFITALEDAECECRGKEGWNNNKTAFVNFITDSLNIAQQGFEAIISEGKVEE